MLVEKILGKVDEYGKDLKIDYVVLDHFELAKPHQKAISNAGETIAISLPHGESLFYRAVLYEDEEKIIAVDLALEDVIKIKPSNTLEWAGAAYNIGNMHSQAYFTEECILVPYDASLERMVKNLGVPFEKTTEKLLGIRANTFTSGEGHSHGHGHEHHHGHK